MNSGEKSRCPRQKSKQKQFYVLFSSQILPFYYLPPLDFWITAGSETEATWDNTHTGSRAWMNGVGRKVGAPRQWYIVFSIPYSTSVILQSTKIHYSRLFVNDKSLCGLLTWYYVVQSQHSRCAGKHRDKRTGPHQILAGIFVYSQINLRQIFRFSKVSLLDYFHFL